MLLLLSSLFFWVICHLIYIYISDQQQQQRKHRPRSVLGLYAAADWLKTMHLLESGERWHCKLVMVVWCTQNVRKDGNSSSYHQPNNNQTVLLPRQWIFITRCVKLQSLIQSRIQLERSGSSRKQRTALYNCSCEANRAVLEMRHSTSVHINKILFFF